LNYLKNNEVIGNKESKVISDKNILKI
jgi:hypothetical protein